MTTFLLHGGFALRDVQSNTSFWQRLCCDLDEGDEVLIVTFAVRDDVEVPQKFEAITQCILNAANSRDVQTILATKEQFLEQLASARAVYIQGGSTSKLLRIFSEYPDLALSLKEKEIIAGSSAGAYALVGYGASHSEKKMREGLGCVPVRLVCHFESSELPPSAEAVKLLRESEQQLPMIFLCDFEWKEILV
jgi:peptidase E